MKNTMGLNKNLLLKTERFPFLKTEEAVFKKESLLDELDKEDLGKAMNVIESYLEEKNYREAAAGITNAMINKNPEFVKKVIEDILQEKEDPKFSEEELEKMDAGEIEESRRHFHNVAAVGSMVVRRDMAKEESGLARKVMEACIKEGIFSQAVNIAIALKDEEAISNIESKALSEGDNEVFGEIREFKEKEKKEKEKKELSQKIIAKAEEGDLEEASEIMSELAKEDLGLAIKIAASIASEDKGAVIAGKVIEKYIYSELFSKEYKKAILSLAEAHQELPYQEIEILIMEKDIDCLFQEDEESAINFLMNIPNFLEFTDIDKDKYKDVLKIIEEVALTHHLKKKGMDKDKSKSRTCNILKEYNLITSADDYKPRIDIEEAPSVELGLAMGVVTREDAQKLKGIQGAEDEILCRLRLKELGGEYKPITGEDIEILEKGGRNTAAERKKEELRLKKNH